MSGRLMIEMEAESGRRDALDTIARMRSALDRLERDIAKPAYRAPSSTCELTRAAATLEVAIQRLSTARLALICMDSDRERGGT